MSNLLADSLMKALAWTLLHSLWQGLLMAVLAAMIMLATRRSSSAWRYALLCSLLFLFLASATMSFLLQWKTGNNSLHLVSKTPALSGTLQDTSILRFWMEKAADFLNRNHKWIVLVWFAVLVCKAGKFFLDIHYLRRLRSHKVWLPDGDWPSRVHALAIAVGIRKKVSFLESALVKVPVVIGQIKPLILFPVGLMNQLAPEEVEAVLLHELAHIRRKDYLVNMIQRFSELLFFFNPGLLWVSSLIKAERENCCDDIAIACTKNKLQFVEALIRCKEHALKTPAPNYALGFLGHKSLVMQRTTRIVFNNNRGLLPYEAAFFILSLALLIALHQGMQYASVPIRPPFTEHLIQNNSKYAELYRNPSTVKPTEIKYNEIQDKPAKLGSINSPASVQKRRMLPLRTISPEEQFSDGLFQQVSLSGQHVQYKQVSEAIAVVNDRYNATREQSEKDRVLAEMDRIQAQKAREQADRDREQADKDRVQAEKYREQANRDREKADRDREQAARDREKITTYNK